MRRFLQFCILLAVLGPGAALAETVRVRSGDHDGFTRILIRLAAPEAWVFGRVDGGFEFRPARTDIDYRLVGIYDRIGRQRIADVRDLGNGRLFLAVDCDCHARAEELADGQVVLDVIRGPSWTPGEGPDARLPDFEDPDEARLREVRAAGSASPPPGDTPSPRAADLADPAKPVEIGDRAGLPLTMPRLRLPVVLAPPPAAPPASDAEPAGSTKTDTPTHPDMPSEARSGQAVDEPQPDTGPERAPPEPTAGTAHVSTALDPETRARVNATEEALLQQIARAAAQGLLDADMGEVDREIAAASPQAVEAPAVVPTIEHPTPPETPRTHITVETSVDRAASGGTPRPDETDEGEICIDPSFFAISDWGGPVENGADIGAYRTRIVGEFDVANGEGITELARNYIFVTFGAEAKALLGRFPDAIERPDLLYAMAEVMDNGASDTAPDFVDQMACPGATALWAVLAQPELRPGQSINREAVALAFNGLPQHLRRHLGPGLADKFLRAGDGATADLIRSGIDRLPGEATSQSAMLSARFDVAQGQLQRATETLDEVIEAGDATMPEALLTRVDLILSDGGAVPEDLVLLLDGLALQHRGTETGRRTTDAAIRARASGTDFQGAFDQLEAAVSGGVVAPERANELEDFIFTRVTRADSDPGFLLQTTGRLEAATRLPAETRRKIATRLFDLGFSEPARTVLDGNGAIPAPEDRRLFARMALAENRPQVAIGYLAGLSTPADGEIRADAMAMAGDFDSAARLYAAGDDGASAVKAAWRGGLWPMVTALDDGPLADAAGLMLDEAAARDATSGAAGTGQASEPVGQPAEDLPAALGRSGVAPTGLPPLSAAQALVDESRATRATLEALFDQIEAPSDPVETGVATGG